MRYSYHSNINYGMETEVAELLTYYFAVQLTLNEDLKEYDTM
jgi:hypothetical protein